MSLLQWNERFNRINNLTSVVVLQDKLDNLWVRNYQLRTRNYYQQFLRTRNHMIFLKCLTYYQLQDGLDKYEMLYLY